MTEEPKNQEQNPMDDEFVEGAGETAAEVSASMPVDTEQAVVPEAEYQRALQELEKASALSKDYFEGWQRERADFANYKRRIERDNLMLAQNIKGDIIKKYLPILDDMDRAMKNRPTEGVPQGWAEGFELIYRKLQNVLEAEGVKRIPAENEPFNPTWHEAITHEDSPDHESGHIIEVVQQGYTLGDRVLRPALVRVAR